MGRLATRTEPMAIEGIAVQEQGMDLRLVVCRVHRHMRVMDFRVGGYKEKRDFLDRFAAREGLRKVYTVVEKADAHAWRTVGFSREGVIPGFFRTSDGTIMTRLYDAGVAVAGGAPKAPAGPKPASGARKYRKPEGARVEVVSDRARIAQAGGDSVTDLRYVALARPIPSPDLAVRVRGFRGELWVTGELDESFGHVRLDLMSPRRGPAEAAGLGHAVQLLTEEARKRAFVTAYALTPLHDEWAAELLASLSFKVTARLVDHIVDGGVGLAHMAIWHRRI